MGNYTFIKVTRSEDDTDVFLNTEEIVKFETVVGATEILFTTENTLRVKQSPTDLIYQIDRVQSGNVVR